MLLQIAALFEFQRIGNLFEEVAELVVAVRTEGHGQPGALEPPGVNIAPALETLYFGHESIPGINLSSAVPAGTLWLFALAGFLVTAFAKRNTKPLFAQPLLTYRITALDTLKLSQRILQA